MNRPQIGDLVYINASVGGMFEIGKVFEVYDRIDVWWDTACGENKVALMDALDEYGEEKAATAEWYAMVEDVHGVEGTAAVASFEVKPVPAFEVEPEA